VPRRLRDSGRHDPLQGARDARDALPRQDDRAQKAGALRLLCRASLQRPVVQPAARGPVRVRDRDAEERHRHREAQALQGQHHQGRRQEPVFALFRADLHLRRERLRPVPGHRLH